MPKYANSIKSTIPKTGPRVPRWTINRGIIEEMKRNCTSSLLDCPFRCDCFSGD